MEYICIFIFFLSLFFYYKAYRLKVEKNQLRKNMQKETQLIQKQKDVAKQVLDQTNSQIQKKQDYLISLNKEKNKIQIQLNNNLQQKRQLLNKYYEDLKKTSQNSFKLYENNLNEEYKKIEKQYKDQIDKVLKEKTLVQQDLDQLKKIYQAATAARLKQQEEQEKLSYYCLKITDRQISDIEHLQQWKHELYDPSIVAKIIWSSYIMKATSDLCNRVVGTTQTCGIYKITNIKTKQVYIGQSVNITDRFKNHIKCGLGIDASSTNKLYNNMQEYGVWNFTFEILQKCSRDKLNEKERFWIDMYQSNKVGMNVTKGNK